MPEYGADAGHLAEYVDAIAPAFLGDVGKIEIVALIETFDLLGRQDLAHVAVEFGIGQLPELDRQQIAIHAQHRRHPDCEVHV